MSTSCAHILCQTDIAACEDCADTTIEVSCEVILICVVASKPCQIADLLTSFLIVSPSLSHVKLLLSLFPR